MYRASLLNSFSYTRAAVFSIVSLYAAKLVGNRGSDSSCEGEHLPTNQRLNRQLPALAQYCVESYVKSNMTIGVGSDSINFFVLKSLAKKLEDGDLSNITVVPTDAETKRQMNKLGLKSIPVDEIRNLENQKVDLAISGLDEVDPDMNALKGSDGNFTRDKLVMQKASKFVYLLDTTQLTSGLGPGKPIPVEVAPFGHRKTISDIQNLPSLKDCRPVVRKGSRHNYSADGNYAATTPGGNYIVDLYFSSPIFNVETAAFELDSTPGVIDHGLFIDVSDDVTFLVTDHHNIRVAGSDGKLDVFCLFKLNLCVTTLYLLKGEPIWWSKLPDKFPSGKYSVDNRVPKSE